MINISDKDKEIWRSDSIHKNLVIRFPNKNITLGNEDLLEESFELTETIEDSTELSFTGCHASHIEFECSAFAVDVRNERIEVSLIAEGAAEMPLFKGYVDEQKRKDYEDETCTIIAYDEFSKLKSLDVAEWYEGLSFPMTLMAFRTALAQHIGLDMVQTELIFDSLQIEKTITADTIFASTLIKSICQLNGVFGRINREGKLEFASLPSGKDVYLYPGETLFPGNIFPGSHKEYDPREKEDIEKARYTNITHEGFKVDYIDKVQIHEMEGDIGGIYGSGTNAYIVENNWLTFGRTGSELDSMAQTLYEKVSEYTYMPCEIECIGLPYLECGDVVEADTAKNHVFAYILSRTLKGIQALEDTYTAEGDKLRSKYVADVHEELLTIKSKYNMLNRTVEETYSEVFDSATGASRIEQNAQAITTKVNTEDVCSVISQSADKISLESNRLSIDSSNFTLSEDGTVLAKSIGITGGYVNIKTGGAEEDAINLNYEAGGHAHRAYMMPSIIGVEDKYNGKDYSVAIHATSDLVSIGLYADGFKNYTTIKPDEIAISGMNVGDPTQTIIGKGSIKVNGRINDVTIDGDGIKLSSYAGIYFNGARNIIGETYGSVKAVRFGVQSAILGTSVLGFFGALTGTPIMSTIQTVNKATSATTLTQLNALISALAAYNLIKTN